MQKAASLLAAGSLVIGIFPSGWADDTMQFYQEEAKVVSASLQPQPANQSPATVYVVTQQDIKDSGAQTIPDALRNVPGVQVIYTTAGQEEVGIRGMDKALNNRVLVLLDGKSVLNGFFNTITWESIPVVMDEIDRIEVVEGPASAVYGADAVSGVINIITKRPEQMQGGRVTYTGGERHTELGSLTYGRKQDNLSYRFGGGWHSTNRFENADALASEAGKFDGLVRYDFSDHQSLSFSGGANNYNTRTSLGTAGQMEDKGLNSFVRADYKYQDTALRAYWNRLRSIPDENPFQVLSGEPSGPLDNDSIDVQLTQAVSLPMKNNVVLGGGYHKDTARSALLNNGNSISQDLWSAFLEDKWEFAPKWMLMLSGRVDRHPLTPIQFSPRGSLLFTPVADQTIRLSASRAFRNPTLLESYFDGGLTAPLDPPLQVAPPPVPPLTRDFTSFPGNPKLDPETIQEEEIAYESRLSRLKTTVSGFHYTYKDAITPSADPNLITADFSTLTLLTPSPFVNSQNDDLHAWGGQLAAEYAATQWLRLFGSYTYEYLHEDAQPEVIAQNTPRHQANVGVRTKNGGWTTQWMLDWVNSTDWSTPPSVPSAPVAAYFLLNAHVGYAFSGALNGLEVGVNAFNLLNHDHYEISPTSEAGEIVKSSLTGTVSYKF